MIYLYDDKNGWGKTISSYLKGRGCKLFHRAEEIVEAGYVFMHASHLPLEEREKDKKIMAELDKRKGLKLIPSAREVVLYDNKVAQYQEFGNWMPETLLAEDEQTALSFVDRLGFPFVSKSKQGAGASNARLIENREQAEKEVKAVFSDTGLDCYANGVQKDYELWQKWIPGLEINWRIVVLAHKYFIITKRWNEENSRFVNDNGKIKTLSHIAVEVKEIVDLAGEFAEANRFKWVAVDIIKEPKTGRLYVLETSAGWPMWWFGNGMIFDKGLEPVEYARDVLCLAGDMILKGDFD